MTIQTNHYYKMTCDWTARVEFHVKCQNGQTHILHDPKVVPVWKTNYSDDACIQDEIEIWKQHSPDTCIYTDGRWIATEFSTANWSGVKGWPIWGQSHIYTKTQILNLIGEMDFIMITVVPIGEIHY